jgi:hypothetical protein
LLIGHLNSVGRDGIRSGRVGSQEERKRTRATVFSVVGSASPTLASTKDL